MTRFPHPSEADKFLLCDSSGQAYIVLCPIGELYNPLIHECRNPTGGAATVAATTAATTVYIITIMMVMGVLVVQELCESRGGRPGLSVLTSLLVSVDVKIS